MIDMNEINEKTTDILSNTWVILEMARDQFAEEPVVRHYSVGA
jgi:hypothetical protein